MLLIHVLLSLLFSRHIHIVNDSLSRKLHIHVVDIIIAYRESLVDILYNVHNNDPLKFSLFEKAENCPYLKKKDACFIKFLPCQ